MGFSMKFNWVLQIVPPDNIELNTAYEFSKNGSRVFPVGTPIDLIDLKRNAVAKIIVKSFTHTQDATVGAFEVVKIYEGNEKQVLSRYWFENQ